MAVGSDLCARSMCIHHHTITTLVTPTFASPDWLSPHHNSTSTAFLTRRGLTCKLSFCPPTKPFSVNSNCNFPGAQAQTRGIFHIHTHQRTLLVPSSTISLHFPMTLLGQPHLGSPGPVESSSSSCPPLPQSQHRSQDDSFDFLGRSLRCEKKNANTYKAREKRRVNFLEPITSFNNCQLLANLLSTHTPPIPPTTHTLRSAPLNI